MRRNWKALISFIKKYRTNGIADFRILTTASEIIIIANFGNADSEQIRLKYK